MAAASRSPARLDHADGDHAVGLGTRDRAPRGSPAFAASASRRQQHHDERDFDRDQSERSRASRGVAASAEPLRRSTCIRSTRDRAAPAQRKTAAPVATRQQRGKAEHVRIDRHVGRARQREAGTPRSSRTPHPASSSRATPPLTPSSSPSTKNSRARRPRLAPRADRSSLRSRPHAAREEQVGDVRTGDQQQPGDAANSACSVGRMPPATESIIGMSGTRPSRCSTTGYSRSSADAIARHLALRLLDPDAVAQARDHAEPGGSRDRSCIGDQQFPAHAANQTSTSWKGALRRAARRRSSPGPAHGTAPPTIDGSPPNRRRHTAIGNHRDRAARRAPPRLGDRDGRAPRGSPARRTAAPRRCPRETRPPAVGAGDHALPMSEDRHVRRTHDCARASRCSSGSDDVRAEPRLVLR